MPCKIMRKNCGSGGSNKIKTKLACILEADESTRMRMGNSMPHYHEDHIAGKGENSLQHYNGHPFAGLLWERQFEKILLKHGWEKIPNWECLFVHREKGSFLSVYVDDIKLAGKKQHLDPMWKLLNKEVDLGEPTSFLDHVYLGCTQRQCQKQRYCGQLQNHV